MLISVYLALAASTMAQRSSVSYILNEGKLFHYGIYMYVAMPSIVA